MPGRKHRTIALTHRALAPIAVALGLACALAPASVLAQYKWIGPDGSVHYGDKPPAGAKQVSPHILPAPRDAKGAKPKAAAPAVSVGPTISNLDVAALPFALRTAVQRHPVILYVTSDCEACDQARDFLLRRGVPFSARSVSMPRDTETFRALGFSQTRFPAIAVGLDLANGFDVPAWTRMLDGAGYPDTPQLPPTWKPMEAVPLV